MTAGQTRAAASGPAVAEIAALGRRLRDPEVERQALTVRRRVWKMAEGWPDTLEHRCCSVAEVLSKVS